MTKGEITVSESFHYTHRSKLHVKGMHMLDKDGSLETAYMGLIELNLRQLSYTRLDDV